MLAYLGKRLETVNTSKSNHLFIKARRVLNIEKNNRISVGEMPAPSDLKLTLEM